jgi:PIN domain nuclease of toxin-antitoxin system
MDQVAATGEVLVISKNGRPVAELHACTPARRSKPLRSPSWRADPWRSPRTDRQPLGGPGVIVLDTHVLLWLDREDLALGPSRRERIRAAWGQGSVAVCATSFWEVPMRAARGRIEQRQSAESWRVDWLRADLEEIALDGAVAVAAAALADFHPDPADRLIAATATGRAANLIMADQALLRWPGPLLCHAAGE